MIGVIVFSKDRAAQLNLLLSSIGQNGTGLFGPIKVLYCASNLDYRRAYWNIQKDFPNIELIEEMSFKKDTEKLLEEMPAYMAFAVDDNILYKRPELNLDRLDDYFRWCCTISLRLGRNTIVQDCHRNTLTVMPRDGYSIDNLLLFNWTAQPPHMNFGYPLSVDFNIFNTEDVKYMLGGTDYHNPNSLECGWQKHLPILNHGMCCLHNSCVVNTPLNRVQDTCQNLAGQFHPVSAEELNNDYLAGWRIDLDAMDFSNIVGAHQELPLKYKTKIESPL